LARRAFVARYAHAAGSNQDRLADGDARAIRAVPDQTRRALTIIAARVNHASRDLFAFCIVLGQKIGCPMKKIAAVMVLGLLPLAGCVNPNGYSSGPYAAYDSDYDQGYDGYDQPYGQAIYGPDRTAYAGSQGPAYSGQPYPNQPYPSRPSYGQAYSGQSTYKDSGRGYDPAYRPPGYASSYYRAPAPVEYGPSSYSAPPPLPAGPPSSYYSTYYRCGCR
jgi:hypothetical protein